MEKPDEAAARLEEKRRNKEARKAVQLEDKRRNKETRKAAQLEDKRRKKEARKAAQLETKRRNKEARKAAQLEAKRHAEAQKAAWFEAEQPERAARQAAGRTKDALARTGFSPSPHPGLVEVRQPMLLITQVKRSGGVLLSRLFDAHPECLTHPRDLRWQQAEDWPSFAVAPSLSPAQAFGLFQEKWIRQLGDGYCYKYTAVKNRIPNKPPYPFVFDRKLAFEIFAERYEQRDPGALQRPLLDAYLTALFNAWLDYQNLYTSPKRWVIGLQAPLISSAHGVERFFSDYPDGRLVTIVRHPGAWLPRTVKRDEPCDLASELAPWHASTRGSLEAVRRYGDQVVVLLFDDLLLHTEATMRALCACLGIAYDPVVRKPTFNSLLLTDTAAVFDQWSESVRAGNYFASHTVEVREALERTAMPTYEEARRVALAPHV